MHNNKSGRIWDEFDEIASAVPHGHGITALLPPILGLVSGIKWGRLRFYRYAALLAMAVIGLLLTWQPLAYPVSRQNTLSPRTDSQA